MNREEQKSQLQSLRKIADLLDTKFTGPFGLKFGLDPLIGLIPVLGDLITLFIAAYIFVQSIQFGLPVVVHVRMLLNILLDQMIKWIPFLGILLDFAWKSNVRNIRLMEQYVDQPTQTHAISWGIVTSVFLFFVMISVVVIYTGVWITLWLVHNMTQLLGVH